jgi:putative ABC transport system permease protein
MALTKAAIGTRIDLELPNGGRRTISIAGTVHDLGVAPAWQEQVVYGYVSAATLASLGEPVSLNNLKLLVSDPRATAESIETTARALTAWLNTRNVQVLAARIPPPRLHPHQTQMNAVITMLLAFSVLGLVLGAMLTATVINALLAEQVRQIAIMKAIGARSTQIATLYLSMVAGLGLFAVAAGLPVGVIAGRKLIAVVGVLLNLRIASLALPWWVYATAIVLGIATPLAATAWPIRRAAWRTVRAALDDHGATSAGGTASARWLTRVRFKSPALTQAFRNVFRRRGRLVMTASLLAGAGALFIASLDLKAAWERNVNDAIRDRNFALEVRLRGGAPRDVVLRAVAATPGVARAESWSRAGASRAHADDLDVTGGYPDGGHGSFSLREAPPDTRAVAHRMTAGRWLVAGDTDAVVLNGMARSIAFADVQVGDTVTLRVDRRPVPLRVVGFVREPLTAGAAMVSPSTFAHATQRADSTNTVRVTLSPTVTERDGTRQIVDALERLGIAVGSVTTESRVVGAQGGHIYILVFALAVIALVMAVVALIGLASSLGVSVLERTREFGVMRAIGCKRSDIIVTVLAEGIVTALLSAVAAVAVSRVVSEIVGRVLASISNQELTLSLSPLSVALWVSGLVLGATLVSWYPARRAARLTVRDALAHI